MSYVRIQLEATDFVQKVYRHIRFLTDRSNILLSLIIPRETDHTTSTDGIVDRLLYILVTSTYFNPLKSTRILLPPDTFLYVF